MDAEIAWEECIPDLPLDTTTLPPLNALSTSSDPHHPKLDLLDLFSLDPVESPHQSPSHTTSPSLESTSPLKHHNHHHPFDTHLPDTLYSASFHTSNPQETLSNCTDVPTTTPSTPPTDTSATTTTADEHSQSPQSDNNKNNEHSSRPNEQHQQQQQDLLLELSTRLASAGAEASALRKRVATLTAENRGLRHALDHANARLVAVAQAAAAHPPPTTTAATPSHHHHQPLMLGLAQVSTEVAHSLGGVLTVSSPDTTDDPRDRKKRKRVAGAATTMACVMFMWGAFVGTPGLLKGNASYRSDGNLPAVWTSHHSRDPSADATAVAPVLNTNDRVHRGADPWQPNCMRVLEQLPHGKEGKEEPKEEPMLTTHSDPSATVADVEDDDLDATNKMFVDMGDEKAANVVARADDTQAVLPDYSYVLCRDAASAIDNIKACRHRLQRGEPCGQPHTISLILPASAAGLEDDMNDTNSGDGMQLAEVQCSIMSVARIPSNAATVSAKSSRSSSSSSSSATTSQYGKVIATVAEGSIADVRQAKSS